MNELALFDSIFNHSLDDFFGGSGYRSAYVPRVDVKEKGGAYTLEMDLPGLTEKDVNIELAHNTLTISSVTEEKKEEKSDKKEEKKGERWLIRERRTTSFSRSFTLPNDAEGEDIKAAFKNGILTVTIPRRVDASPKRIAIAAE